ncbi:MAG: hypothetical protein QOC93_2923 [Actinomycetota bacterium]|jgi:hypothetical protein|nr:hypothetical protein [Actinomycetota bacterium]
MNAIAVPATLVGAEPTPADLLRGAAAYIEAHGWHQGALYNRVENPDTPPACTVGAVYITGCGLPVAAIDMIAVTDPLGHIRDALHALLGHLDGTDRPLDLDRLEDHLVAYELHIGDWNDHADRTITQVTTALRDAADEWDRRNPTGGAA